MISISNGIKMFMASTSGFSSYKHLSHKYSSVSFHGFGIKLGTLLLKRNILLLLKKMLTNGVLLQYSNCLKDLVKH